ncbi:MAG: hypothetical protein COV55_04475 [Candidatus Komeilibacteria bacterium CG11_big_fil_rev_8_21_14_0_20_36_20]|uniref:Nudix hydrolase domain-containing protein n=1 Tax=Candidatus Komeilibacteria bacterium CG11_big_fil_rev_8_21_14_0_20_36_20 TaxID=1974477 RepID=A0A2H0NBL9_9BACT|nr:MAG: hypothetical protein COV55_04475 [Candidatus Komeilibacteria bacterium CG11_big_fil_rev_8_21_14_0_20_36_20]PIR81706.1 MAG: hypothetical protein COU21_02040 [Candidatus Komeilibacteria bacterium CG10_big_fil_rev_8_21_14_0_10_36_65]PJC54905.1 MAG: hypothetical protein CO027_04855 [Candidatus Komeilibacteria bacterium CG_4_9_14_0_2_um_filter_36_13]
MQTQLAVAAYIIHNNKVLLIHHQKLDLWLPVGGHIDQNETPDDALLREIREEVNLEVEILNKLDLPVEGKTKKNLALPFYTNVHSVGDHDHACFYYVCKVINPEKININQKEIKNFDWFTKEELNQKHISENVRNQALEAFKLFEKLTK